MSLTYILIALFVIAIIAFILSFFQKDHYKILHNEFEQFTLQQMQENYLFKKKLKILEEELLISDGGFEPTREQQPSKRNTVHEILKNQVLSLAKQGATVKQISKQSALSVSEVQEILNNNGMRGN